ncbi:MAG TPA: aminoglycoside phosphotransferase family protein [Bacteroidetes bacterium]|nr:aminoglycoside phosphotransferase family protein [Bacteroidota bacterium]
MEKQEFPHDILKKFRLPGPATLPTPYGSGLVNRSYVFSCHTSGRDERFLLQEINTHVFREPEKVMENILTISRHIRNRHNRKDSGEINGHLIPELIQATDKNYYIRDNNNRYWRIYRFVENSLVLNEITHPGQAYEAARMFGKFFRELADLNPRSMHLTIPGFHDLSLRFARLEEALKRDPSGRKTTCGEETEKAMACRHLEKESFTLVHEKKLPIRITHNDTKINNVLLDEHTGRGLCVIDLDTVMPSSVLSDFGDMMRTFVPSAGEEETDTGKIMFRLPVFESMAGGFLSECGKLLTSAEKEYLVFGGKMMTLMQAVRFLTDYLNGDIYYATERPGHNLQRARNQLRVLELFTENEQVMQQLTASML